MSLTPAQIKPKSSELRRNSFFTWDGCVGCLRGCLGTKLLPQSYQYLNLLEGTDLITGQLHRDKECPFSGVTMSGRVWRKVPESNARSVSVSVKMLTKTGKRVMNSGCESDRLEESKPL